MRHDEGASISFKCFFEDLARVDRSMGNRASKEFVALDQTAAGVEVQAEENFVRKAPNLGLQELPDMVWRCKDRILSQLLLKTAFH